MLTNADITLYHKSYNPGARLDEWISTKFHRVNWHAKQAVSVGDKGLNSADTLVVRIPTSDEIEVSPGDIVVRGLIDDRITSPAQLSLYDRFTVTAIRDNRRGSPCMHHWRIEGV